MTTAQAVEPIEPSIEKSAVEAKSAPPPAQRLVSLDVYRGFVMLLMASEGLGIIRVAKNLKEIGQESAFWNFLAIQTDHVQWSGCVLWDLIQPSFMFMVGVSMPYSLASRRAKGETFVALLLHALWRSLLLGALGIYLRSTWLKSTNFIFTDVLTQIGLGYTFLFLLAWTKPRTQAIVAFGILLAYWAAFALYPLPPQGFDYSKVGVGANWTHLQGFAAHWDKNTNIAAAFDQWFLNLFPREKAFVFSEGGYQTLNFIPSLATMIFGLLAGGLMRDKQTEAMKKFHILVVAGLACLAVGFFLDYLGICPSVKRIWTPAWAIYSTGWTCLMLGSFYFIVDLQGFRAWAFPCLVVGMNSIAMYVMAHLTVHLIEDSVKIHLGQHVFELLGTTYAPIVTASTVLLGLWLICFWMYRRKIFLRI